MKIFKNNLNLKREILKEKNLSFVPTMGSLHKGHEFLIKKAKKKGGKVIVSLFVNPKQFNSKNDFNNYPRNLHSDLNILKALKVNYIYIPNYKDIFSFKTKCNPYLDKINNILCGKFRKSHFKGVLNVVNRFLDIVKPRYLYLGKKDLQQLYLIAQHIKKNKINTKIIECKTIRENNGVACSSRNKRLKQRELNIASKVYKLILRKKKLLKKQKNLKLFIIELTKTIKSLGVTKIEYIEILNIKNLKKPQINKDKYNIFISYYLGKTRLIDNI